ncbi:hypothetical protein SSX86_011925 [Deinandra increscens subsp. villosa]|uniref:MADS box interactor-like n=1 Tax=Deinandra increscens subsp. villosa TaxID=3103831 RepID=A0AAP0H0G3_9ASTR
MEVVEVSGGAKPIIAGVNSERDQVRVKRKTLEAVLDQCQRALELLSSTGCVEDDDESCDEVAEDDDSAGQSSGRRGPSSPPRDGEADLLCSLLKSRVECPDFLEKLESAQVSVPQNLAEDNSSWDMVSENDLWEGGNITSDEDYVLVRQDDIVDGIACFMAAYLISLKETKVHFQNNSRMVTLSKTFSMKKQKGKLRKAWDGSKVIYNVASWGATAIGIYQNPAILRAASAAFWTSCNVISKLF